MSSTSEKDTRKRKPARVAVHRDLALFRFERCLFPSDAGSFSLSKHPFLLLRPTGPLGRPSLRALDGDVLQPGQGLAREVNRGQRLRYPGGIGHTVAIEHKQQQTIGSRKGE